MRILIVHNRYQKHGGEDVVFDSESALLERNGHEVVRFSTDNRATSEHGRAALALNAVWNGGMLRQVRALIQQTRPDVMHVHNTLPLLSPAIYYAASREGVPVVQTLHNFRLLCPQAELLRGGKICEDCVGTRTHWPGIVHGCYRGSRSATAVVAATVRSHALLGTWHTRIDRYIAISEFMRRKYVEGGWPAEKITVKPNFFDGPTEPGGARGNYVVFVGRLSEQKGVRTLLSALSRMPAPPRVKMAGQGPLLPADLAAYPNIEWLGHLPRQRVIEVMQGAGLLVFPAESYEGGPLAIIEAFATHLPVIASNLGSMAEMVTDGKTGRLFEATNAADLADVLTWALAHPGEMKAMADEAYREYQRKYTPLQTYRTLMAVYRGVIKQGLTNGATNSNAGDAGDRDRFPTAQFRPSAGPE